MKQIIAAGLFATAVFTSSAFSQIRLSDSMAGAWSEGLQRAVNLSRHAEYGEAIKQYQELLSSRQLDSNVELHAYVSSQMADAEIELGNYREAEATTKDALRALASAGKAHTGTFAIAEGVLADTLRAEGDYAEAKRFAEHAIKLAANTLDFGPQRIGILLTTLGQILQEAGDLPEAEQLCRRAVNIFGAADQNDISLGNAYQNLAVVYAKRRKLKQALDAVSRAIACWNRSLPANHPFLAYALSTKIVIYQEMRSLLDAEQVIPEALKLARIWFGPDRPEFMVLLNNCAGVYLAEGKYSQAEAMLHEAAEIGRRRLTEGHPVLISVLRNYAYVLEKLHRQDEAARARAESEVLLAFPERLNFSVIR